MAVPNTLLNTLRSPAPAGQNPLQKLDEAPFAGADSAGFSSHMLEAVGPSSRHRPKAQGTNDPQAGNVLPESAVSSMGFVAAKTPPATDSTLEEFAVQMGIDRSLARLLLSGTANDAVAVEPEVALDLNPEVAMSPRDVSLPSTVPVAAELPLPLFISAAPAAVPVTLCEADAAMPPLADEDLLLWRASVGRADLTGSWPVNPRTTNVQTSIEGATSVIVRTAEALPSAASDFLKTFIGREVPSAISSMPNPLQDEIAVPTVIGREVLIDSTPLVSTSIIESTRAVIPTAPSFVAPMLPKLKPEGDIRSIHELLLRRGARGVDTSAPDVQVEMPLPASAEQTVTASSAMTGAAGVVASLNATTNPLPVVAASTSAAIAAVTVSAEASAQGQSFDGNAPPPASAELARVLSTPDPKLSFGERVQAFADAVAQRVLGQIRSENWSVSLQLDPANLGAMEIDLTLRGNAVAANVGVASTEVRALLEAGLPRLKESLEASGLQLANWSFGQSGSRGFGESLPTPFAWQPLRGGLEDSDDSGEPLSRVALRRNDGAVDLFV